MSWHRQEVTRIIDKSEIVVVLRYQKTAAKLNGISKAFNGAVDSVKSFAANAVNVFNIQPSFNLAY